MIDTFNWVRVAPLNRQQKEKGIMTSFSSMLGYLQTFMVSLYDLFLVSLQVFLVPKSH